MDCRFLAVSINRENDFYIPKDILIPKSRLISRLISKETRNNGTCHNIELNGFPGGSNVFELVIRFLLTESTAFTGNITKETGASALRTGFQFLEIMDQRSPPEESSIYKTVKSQCSQNIQEFINDMPTWSLWQCMSFLKICDLEYGYGKDDYIVQQCVDSISSKISSWLSSSPIWSSPQSQYSSDTSESFDPHIFTWVPEHISRLSIPIVEQLIKSMAFFNVDNKFLARCIFQFLQTAKCRASPNGNGDSFNDAMEVGIGLLHGLEWDCMSCRSLFDLQRLAIKIRLSELSRSKIEDMIGFQLENATVDDLLITSNHHSDSLYDVDVILRLVNNFLEQLPDDPCAITTVEAVKKIANLLDQYLPEIAPDPRLTVEKFMAVVNCLPQYARERHDNLYRALDLYLQAHPMIEEASAVELCEVVDCRKLSLDARKHMAQNPHLPLKIILHLLLEEQASIKALVNHHTREHHTVSPIYSGPLTGCDNWYFRCHHMLNNDNGSTFTSSCRSYQNPSSSINSSHYSDSLSHRYRNSSISSGNYNDNTCPSNKCCMRRSLYEQVTLDYEEEGLGYQNVLQENQVLRNDLHHMQSKVLELEKICSKMKTKVTKYLRHKPLLC